MKNWSFIFRPVLIKLTLYSIYSNIQYKYNSNMCAKLRLWSNCLDTNFEAIHQSCNTMSITKKTFSRFRWMSKKKIVIPTTEFQITHSRKKDLWCQYMRDKVLSIVGYSSTKNIFVLRLSCKTCQLNRKITSFIIFLWVSIDILMDVFFHRTLYNIDNFGRYMNKVGNIFIFLLREILPYRVIRMNFYI